jgi:hypothetical protein
MVIGTKISEPVVLLRQGRYEQDEIVNTTFLEYPAQDLCHNELRWLEQYPTALANLVEVLPLFQRDQDLYLLGYRRHPYRGVRVIPQGYQNPKMFACALRKEGASSMR